MLLCNYLVVKGSGVGTHAPALFEKDLEYTEIGANYRCKCQP